ncbi:MAG: hypothetical protein R3324_12280 [Halobacteriales archaeon]|nr:hypothetical protein [Halobacteriales archaeon]
MAFDAAIPATWGEFLADFKTKVEGMTNWSAVDESDWPDPVPDDGTNHWFVVQTPHADYIRFLVDFRGRMGINMEWGDDWDSVNDTWNNEYNTSMTDVRDDGINNDTEWVPKDNNANRQMGATDNCRYWMEYVDDKGFAWYVQREEADGQDGDLFMAIAEINPLWSFHTAAANPETRYTFSVQGGYVRNDQNEIRTNSYFNRTGYGNSSNATITGEGIVNPDTNLSNFPWKDNIIGSSIYRNSDGEDAIIGDHQLFIRDQSGGDSQHRDTVQDGGATDIYTLLKRNNCDVGLRMD